MSAPRDLLAVARQIRRPTLIIPGYAEPEEFTSLQNAAARIRQLAAGEPVTARVVRCEYPQFDAFFGLSLRAGSTAFAYFADRWTCGEEAQGEIARVEAAIAAAGLDAAA